tara:strand:+ start:315 stop:2204 length:1890 start_codon:yes stop_codon:yes gene_type:complete
MCGIVGYINTGNYDNLYRSTKIIKHRGPDAINVKWFNEHNSGLGHARLSIIDLSDVANQPMHNADNNTYIVFNGEIYNYKEIRFELIKLGFSFSTNSDTEVIHKAFYKWGKDCIKKFNGMFSFAIFDKNSGDLLLCRDRLGIKPLYYYFSANSLIFASEIKSILEADSYVKEIDYNAFHTSIHYQVAPYTGFKNIKKLEPGHILNFSNGKIKIEKYWDIKPIEVSMDYKNTYDQLDYLINDSIKLNMVSDVPIGALLSGGLDSSLICAIMQKHLTNPINTFTIKFDKADLKRQGNVDDASYAKLLAEKFGFNHREIVIKPDIVNLIEKITWHLDEPLADPSAINTYLISKEARARGVKVLLSGMGADEVFSGYRFHLAAKISDFYSFFPKILHSNLKKIVSLVPQSSKNTDFKYIRWLKAFLRVASLPQLERALAINNSALSSDEFKDFYKNSYDYENTYYYKKYRSYFKENEDLSYLSKLCFCDTKIYLPDHNLLYSDKAMMAAGVEGRPPLIDHRIIEFMFKLPPKFRLNFLTQKYLLKKVSEKYLPRKIIYRPKAPFSAPMRGWLRNELNDMVNDLLSVRSIKNRGIYNPKYVQKLLKENNSGMKDNSQLIWRLMVNETWFRKYFD